MSRRHYWGVIEAVGDSVGLRGTERFSVSVAADGSRTLHATCEIFDRSVSKDIVHSVDASWRPIDSYVRLIKNGALLGTGWYRFTEKYVELESWNRELGRVSQRIERDEPLRTFGPHPLSCDIWHLAAFDQSACRRVRRRPLPVPPRRVVAAGASPRGAVVHSRRFRDREDPGRRLSLDDL